MRWAKAITTTAVATDAASGHGSATQRTGPAPINRSRTVPPPTAVTTASTTTPSQSIPARTATAPPEMAKATVPMISRTRKGSLPTVVTPSSMSPGHHRDGGCSPVGSRRACPA